MARRIQRLRRILWLALRPIPEWGDTVQSILSILIIIAPTVAGILKRFTGSADWTVRDGVFASIGLFVAAVILAAYRIQEKLDDALDGVPKLLFKGVSFRDNALTMNELEMTGSPAVATTRQRIAGTPTFYHLKIANEPAGTIDRKTAEKVAGRVQIFNQDDTPAADERLHRWEDSPSPDAPGVGKMADRLIPLDIPPSGVEYKLDIAMKYENEEAFYTPNNETALTGIPGWRDKQFEFPPGTYIAKVKLQGTNVVTHLTFQILNKGNGSKLEITPLSN